MSKPTQFTLAEYIEALSEIQKLRGENSLLRHELNQQGRAHDDAILEMKEEGRAILQLAATIFRTLSLKKQSEITGRHFKKRITP
jgi:hypothetical protein